MPRIQAAPVVVTERERTQLESLVRQHSCPQQVALRARIVLAAAAEEGVRESVRRLGAARSTVQHWRRRWSQSSGRVAERLADAPRPGTPAVVARTIPQAHSQTISHRARQLLPD